MTYTKDTWNIIAKTKYQYVSYIGLVVVRKYIRLVRVRRCDIYIYIYIHIIYKLYNQNMGQFQKIVDKSNKIC